MITPVSRSFAVWRGTTMSVNITLVNSGVGTPVNLTGYSASLQVGPYITIPSTNPTVSGSVVMGGAAGTIQVTISGAFTNIYSSQPYFISLTEPNSNYEILMNGRINFVDPFNQATLPPPMPLTIGTQDVTIQINDPDDFP